MMKLLSLFLILGLGLVSARTTAQTISLSEKQATLKQVFKAITAQAKGYEVLYNSDQVNTSLKVDATISKASLEEALTTVLKTTPYTYTIEGKTIVISPKPATPQVQANANLPIPPPPVDVRGKVVNEKGEPLAGVSVLVKGTKRGTSTDENGVFELKGLSEDAVLVFSGVNIDEYSTPLKGRTEFNFTAKAKVSTLQDVEITAVNTGFQKIPKERATGSFSSINNSLLNERVTASIIDRIEGLSSGVAFAKGASASSGRGRSGGLTVRGLSTLSNAFASQEPLIVIDNFPYEGDLNNINPNDVQSITILKDAAAASIWGAKAGNGVIVITTKLGKYNSPLKVSANSNFTVSSQPDLFYTPSMPSTEFIDLQKFLFTKGYYDASLTSTNITTAVSPVVDILAKLRSGSITQAQADAQINGYRGLDLRNNISQYLYRKPFAQQYSVNVSGGTNNINYYFSLGYDKTLGENVGVQGDRKTVKNQTVINVSKSLEWQVGFVFTQSNNKRNATPPPTVVAGGSYNWPYAQLKDQNGNNTSFPFEYRESYTDTAGAGKLLDWKYRPIDELTLTDFSVNQQDVLFNTGFKYKVLSFLSIEGKYQYEIQNNSQRRYAAPESYEVRNLINKFTPSNSDFTKSAIPYGGILDLANNDLTSNSFRGQVNFNKKWGRHDIVAIAGIETRQTVNSFKSDRTYGFDNYLNTFKAVDYVNAKPIYTGGTAFITNAKSFTDTKDFFLSYFANAAYTYSGRYILSASARRDASNLFGVSTNNRWKPLWSAGLSWLLSEEKFYRSSFLPYLKLRTTFGFQGNINNTIAGLLTVRYFGTNSSNQPAAVISNVPNPSLRWEEVGQTNLGLDFGFKNSIVSGSIDYYVKNCKDLIANVAGDPTIGVTSIMKNVAELRTQGIDIDVNTKIMDGRFKWTNTVIFSYNTNKVLKYFEKPLSTGSYIVQGSGSSINPLEGMPAYMIVSYKNLGLDPLNGSPLGFVGGKSTANYSDIVANTTPDSLVYSGTSRPKYFGAFRNTFSWKGFDFSFNILYSFGHFFKRTNYIDYSNLFRGSLTGYSDYQQRWQNPGDEKRTNVPSLIYPANSTRDEFYANSEAIVENAGSIRLQYINLAYTVNVRNIKIIKSLQVYANLSNVGILWKATKQKIDPDTGGAPLVRNIAFGLRADF